jgi:DNA-binding MarR family transcriptional regulator
MEDKVSQEQPRQLPTSRDIEVMYQEVDRLYYKLARGCGLSETAYWILYEIVMAGGSATQQAIAQTHSMSRQTVNSALKSLEQKGLVSISFAEGSRRSKVVKLTDAGQSLCDKRIVPGINAEKNAFDALPEQDRIEFVRLGREYAAAVRAEVERLFSGEGASHE